MYSTGFRRIDQSFISDLSEMKYTVINVRRIDLNGERSFLLCYIYVLHLGIKLDNLADIDRKS